MFFENRIKKEYRNEQIVRKKTKDFEISKCNNDCKVKKIKVFPEIEGNKYYSFTVWWNTNNALKGKPFKCENMKPMF